MPKIVFEQYGFLPFKCRGVWIKYCFDWVAIVSPTSKKHFKWEVSFFEKPIYNQGKEAGKYITSLYAIDDIELDSWLASIQYEIQEASYLHNRIDNENLTVSSYVKHREFDSPNGFMIKTSNTLDIKKTKRCEIMIGDTELFPEGVIIEVSTYDILPTFFTFPHPFRMPGVVCEETKGPATKDEFKYCHDSECEISYGDKSKFITIDDYYRSFYISKNLNNPKIESMRKNLKSINEIIIGDKVRWFNNCPKCGAVINKDIIKTRAAKY